MGGIEIIDYKIRTSPLWSRYIRYWSIAASLLVEEKSVQIVVHLFITYFLRSRSLLYCEVVFNNRSEAEKRGSEQCSAFTLSNHLSWRNSLRASVTHEGSWLGNEKPGGQLSAPQNPLPRLFSYISRKYGQCLFFYNLWQQLWLGSEVRSLLLTMKT